MRPELLNIFKTFPGGICVGNYEMITFRLLETNHTPAVIYFFIRPEMTANIIAVEHLAKTGYPFVCIFSGLNTIDRHVVTGSKINIRLHNLSGWRCPIFMESVNKVVVKRFSKYIFILVPSAATE